MVCASSRLLRWGFLSPLALHWARWVGKNIYCPDSCPFTRIPFQPPWGSWRGASVTQLELVCGSEPRGLAGHSKACWYPGGDCPHAATCQLHALSSEIHQCLQWRQDWETGYYLSLLYVLWVLGPARPGEGNFLPAFFPSHI